MKYDRRRNDKNQRKDLHMFLKELRRMKRLKIPIKNHRLSFALILCLISGREWRENNVENIHVHCIANESIKSIQKHSSAFIYKSFPPNSLAIKLSRLLRRIWKRELRETTIKHMLNVQLSSAKMLISNTILLSIGPKCKNKRIYDFFLFLLCFSNVKLNLDE